MNWSFALHGKYIPLFFNANLYQRPKFNNFFAVEMENDIPTYQSYGMKRLVDKRVRKYNKSNVTQYLMRWLKYGFEHDQWKKKSIFNDCLKLVKKYKTTFFT